MPRSLLGVALALLVVATTGLAQPPGFPRTPRQPPPRPNLPRPPLPKLPAMPSPPIYLPPPIVVPPILPPLPPPPPLAPPPTVPADPGQALGTGLNGGRCSGCGKEVVWVGGASSAPTKCPHCGVRIGHVDNGDGTRTMLRGGPATGPAFSGLDWLDSPVWGVVILVLSLLPIVAVGVAIALAPRSKRRTRRATRPRRPPEDDDDDDPPPRPARPRRDDAIPEATLADDPGYEVVTDPPRRAKAKLLRPDGSPQ